LFSSSGKTTTTGIVADRVFYRDANIKSAFGISFDYRDTQNYISGVKLGASSQRLSTIGISLEHNHRLVGGVASLRGGIRHGLPILGAERDKTPDKGVPRSQFTKLSLYGSFFRPIPLESVLVLEQPFCRPMVPWQSLQRRAHQHRLQVYNTWLQ